jgi:NADH-quinone oxidoreductase subunit G
MAAAAETSQMVEITIDGIDLEVPVGEMIVESVKRIGLEIPIFCYHPRLKPVGMCRMCLVEVGFKQEDGSARMMPKPQAACTLPAGKGMVIKSTSEQIEKDRQGVLEFLLINHPLDCPICDRGGECPLQNNTLAYGPGNSRYIETKRHLPKAVPLSKYVTLDLERCIQCGRCVRFTEEISGDAQLAFRFRGAEMQPSTFQLTDFDSKFSGNVIEICPVGALTSSTYRFRARPWDLETSPGICTVTSCGTNIWFDHRGGKLARINGRTNEAVNEEWTCDKTKFGHAEIYNSPKRMKSCHKRSGDGFEAISWSDAWKTIQDSGRAGSDVGVIAGTGLSNEGFYSLKKFFNQSVGTQNVDHRVGGFEGDFTGTVNVRIADLEDRDAIVIFGGDAAEKLPMTYLRTRKAWFNNGTKVIVASPVETGADSFAHAVLRYSEGADSAAAAVVAALLKGAKPTDADLKSSGISPSSVDLAAEALKAESRAVIAPKTLTERTGGVEAAQSLSAAAGAEFSLFATRSNEQGACEIGILPNGGLNTKQMLEAARDGKLKSLWLVDFDPLEEYPDVELAEQALENVEFLVVAHTRETECAAYASVILPISLPAEHDGTYTSCERRVQRMAPVLSSVGEAKPAWRVFTEGSLRANESGSPAFSAAEVMERIIEDNPEFSEAMFDNLDGEGAVLGQAADGGQPGPESQV